MYINGRNAVIEALRANLGIEKVFLMYGVEGEPIRRIRKEAKQAGVPCVMIDKGRFLSMEKEAGLMGPSQGVIALMSQMEYVDLEVLIDEKLQRGEVPIITAMDGITDPHNVGAIIRSAECAGLDGVLIGKHDAGSITDTVMRASSGAVSHIPIARAGQIIDVLMGLQQMGMVVVGLDERGEMNYTEYDFTVPTAFVVGSEGSGLQPRVRKLCDHLVSIPMQGRVASLNASVAAGVVFFEALRQRRDQQSESGNALRGLDDSMTEQ